MDDSVPVQEAARVSAAWKVLLGTQPAGWLQLWRSASGYRWKWADKPGHLVQLVGVDASNSQATPADSAWSFPDAESAVAHLMHCTGIAFPSGCGLTAA